MKYIAYYRVSTQKQGQSGLGLEGQQAAVAAFAGAQVLASYTEIETGTSKRERPQLAKAVNHCRRTGAALIIAKLDRLARNVAFVANLMESGVEFVACDNPTANRLTLHILAAVAEDEARRISERTKAALAAYKVRGGLLGASLPACRNLTGGARARGAEAMRAKSRKAAAEVLPLARELRDDGYTLQQIADQLNENGELTIRGNCWNAVGVMRVLARDNATNQGGGVKSI